MSKKKEMGKKRIHLNKTHWMSEFLVNSYFTLLGGINDDNDLVIDVCVS